MVQVYVLNYLGLELWYSVYTSTKYTVHTTNFYYINYITQRTIKILHRCIKDILQLMAGYITLHNDIITRTFHLCSQCHLVSLYEIFVLSINFIHCALMHR